MNIQEIILSEFQRQKLKKRQINKHIKELKPFFDKIDKININDEILKALVILKLSEKDLNFLFDPITIYVSEIAKSNNLKLDILLIHGFDLFLKERRIYIEKVIEDITSKKNVLTYIQNFYDIENIRKMLYKENVDYKLIKKTARTVELTIDDEIEKENYKKIVRIAEYKNREFLEYIVDYINACLYKNENVKIRNFVKI
ncbi:MAG: hypothetical protein N2505_00545 [Endomicrobia bacterium]|nr:hypothetical protein [Endomicrobiia bacterium]